MSGSVCAVTLPLVSTINCGFYPLNISMSSNQNQRYKYNCIRKCIFKYSQYDVLLSGCYDYRDFIPGQTIIDNIVRAIEKSNRVILILTEDFVTSNWCQYEADMSIIEHLKFEL